MRRTVPFAMALACTAVLASTVPAFADGPTSPSAAPARPSATRTPAPATRASAVPSAAPARPTDRTARGEVAVVPSGAPDTGVGTAPAGSAATEGLIGAGAAALAAGGAAVFVVRRRRATVA